MGTGVMISIYTTAKCCACPGLLLDHICFLKDLASHMLLEMKAHGKKKVGGKFYSMCNELQPEDSLEGKKL